MVFEKYAYFTLYNFLDEVSNIRDIYKCQISI